MKIKMLKSTRGAVNGGLFVKVFEEGKVYNSEDMGECADVFLDIGVAEKYTPPPEAEKYIKRQEAKIERKMEAQAPQNKSVNKVDEDYFKDMKAGQIRQYAAKRGIDLTDVPGNTGASKLAKIVVERR